MVIADEGVSMTYFYLVSIYLLFGIFISGAGLMLQGNVISFFYSAPFICYFNFIVQVKQMFKSKKDSAF